MDRRSAVRFAPSEVSTQPACHSFPIPPLPRAAALVGLLAAQYAASPRTYWLDSWFSENTNLLRMVRFSLGQDWFPYLSDAPLRFGGFWMVFFVGFSIS
jgi:hypothetical protein